MEFLVDPSVSMQKFEQEIARYREVDDEHFKRGCWILRAKFPEVFVVFATPQLKPPSVLFGVLLNFTNFDFWPPSVQFVDPFTGLPLKYSELNYKFLRQVKTLDDSGRQVATEPQPLLQAHVDEKPFLCLPGVREYHEHPAHTGDSWFLHRGKGEGSLYFLLEKIYLYGIKPIKKYNFQLTIQVAGFQVDIPE